MKWLGLLAALLLVACVDDNMKVKGTSDNVIELRGEAVIRVDIQGLIEEDGPCGTLGLLAALWMENNDPSNLPSNLPLCEEEPTLDDCYVGEGSFDSGCGFYLSTYYVSPEEGDTICWGVVVDQCFDQGGEEEESEDCD